MATQQGKRDSKRIAIACIEAMEERRLLSMFMLYDATDSSNPWNMTPTSGAAVSGGTTFFSATDPTHGRELWKTDGTVAGTGLVADIDPGTNSGNPSAFAVKNGILYFAASDPTHGRELWRSDGTPAGTYMVKDINTTSPTAGSNPDGLVVANNMLYFVADDGTSGVELWKSDGTEAGTVRVKDINPGAASSSPSFLTSVNGTLFFGAITAADGAELWKSDGTEAGTVEVKNINAGAAGSYPQQLVNVNGTLFFSAGEVGSGGQLWKSDGTDAGTVRLTDANGATGIAPSLLTDVNGTLFFSADDGVHGRELWKSDGTSAGTAMVADINPNAAASNPVALLNLNGTLLFVASDGTHGYELWKSDGTTAGTTFVKDINPGSPGSSPDGLMLFRGMAVFSATDAASGTELWQTDGTTAGTTMLRDINPGMGSSSPVALAALPTGLLLSATDGTHGAQPWIYIPPTVSISGADGMLVNRIYTLTLSCSDSASATGPTSWTIDWGDGHTETVVGDSSTSLQVPHVFTKSGRYVVTASANDTEGPHKAQATLAVTAFARPATISGSVYSDIDGNGKHGRSEPFLARQKVFIDANNNGILDSGEIVTKTDTRGRFTFTDVTPGTTHICAIPGSGWRVSGPTGAVHEFSLTSGQVMTKKDFGLTQLAQIRGRVFSDANANGIKDTGETGLAGWLVYADLNRNGKLDRYEPSATTDVLGNYSLSVPAGLRVIRVVPQTGFTRTSPARGVYTQKLGKGSIALDFDFGFHA